MKKIKESVKETNHNCCQQVQCGIAGHQNWDHPITAKFSTRTKKRKENQIMKKMLKIEIINKTTDLLFLAHDCRFVLL